MVDRADLDKSLQDVQDTDDIEQVQAQLDSAKRELETFKEALAEKEAEKQNYKEQVDVLEVLRQLQYENYRILEPRYEFEKMDEYWEAAKKQLWYKQRQERQTDKGVLDRFDAELKSIQERIDANASKIEKLQSLLEE